MTAKKKKAPAMSHAEAVARVAVLERELAGVRKEYRALVAQVVELAKGRTSRGVIPPAPAKARSDEEIVEQGIRGRVNAAVVVRKKEEEARFIDAAVLELMGKGLSKKDATAEARRLRRESVGLIEDTIG